MSPYSLNIYLEISILVIILLALIGVASVFIVRHLRTEYKKVYKVQSKFDIELRKLINIMHNFLEIDSLEKYHKLVIKKLSHDEKSQILDIIESAYQDINLELEENAYIIETYQRLQEVRRDRDSKVIIYNDKLSLFPFNLYAKILKFQKFYLYTPKE
ncbi:MAG: hypothetical protein AB7E09_06030 [Candidatus Izemoplasmatales bacterium]|uniref:LemA family protein n=1 Tax=Hujiaoplasma nucleasis TaxID=2725268 RepID=A0A7L6N3C1_9MOLU|nr:hypothetical protein [Hujiaoplasma nucleasis]QLY40041.1 hypothetical protein HF295_03870 [Hujiaoplasma nucleasis]